MELHTVLSVTCVVLFGCSMGLWALNERLHKQVKSLSSENTQIYNQLSNEYVQLHNQLLMSTAMLRNLVKIHDNLDEYTFMGREQHIRTLENSPLKNMFHVQSVAIVPLNNTPVALNYRQIYDLMAENLKLLKHPDYKAINPAHETKYKNEPITPPEQPTTQRD